MKPLYIEKTERFRVYRPCEAPQKAKDKACEREYVEPQHLTESVFGTCDETGIRGELAAVGVKLETGRKVGPSWQLDGNYLPGMTGSVVDVAKFLGSLDLSAADVRRLLYVEQHGGISLSMRPGRHTGTVAESAFGDVQYPTKEIAAAQERLRDAWTEFVQEWARRAQRLLQDERDFLCSWLAIAERLEANGEGIDDNGRAWPLPEEG